MRSFYVNREIVGGGGVVKGKERNGMEWDVLCMDAVGTVKKLRRGKKGKRKRKRKRKPIASGMSCVRVSVGHAVGARLHGGVHRR